MKSMVRQVLLAGLQVVPVSALVVVSVQPDWSSFRLPAIPLLQSGEGHYRGGRDSTSAAGFEWEFAGHFGANSLSAADLECFPDFAATR